MRQLKALFRKTGNEGFRTAFMKRILAIRKMERDGLIIEHPKKRKDLYQTYVQQGMQQSRGLLQYNQMLHIDLNKLVHQQKKLSKKVKILDVGAGEGATLLELKDSHRSLIETHAIGLRRAKHNHFIDKTHVGPIENYRFKEKFNIITSYGGIHYAQNFPLVLEKICNSLIKGGVAAIQITPRQAKKLPLKELRKAGFKIKKYSKPATTITITNTNGHEINLEKEIHEAVTKPTKFKFSNEHDLRH
jgi:SAM-dependent methyltransferase